jgi:hypothetical protein
VTVYFEQLKLFPTTMTWQEACGYVVKKISLDDVLIEHPYTNIIDLGNRIVFDWEENVSFSPEGWIELSLSCADCLNKLSGQSRQDVLAETHRLLVTKQKDYGKQNIKIFGVPGIMIRVSDKIERMKNLVKKSGAVDIFSMSESNNSVPNESLIDTLFDIIGYSIIAIMLQTQDVASTSLFDCEMSYD